MRFHNLSIGLAAGAFLAACTNDSTPITNPPPPPPTPPAMATFEVTVSNLTNAQPLSPVAVIAHGDGYNVFTVGEAATAGLEVQAEGGDPADLIAEADADANVRATASGGGIIPPGGQETIQFQVLTTELAGLRVSASTMLVNTNDAITVLNGFDASGLTVNSSAVTTRTIAYDAGTEADTEQAAHIPGPAGGGEGFNAARDDEADRVSMHSGVVTQDDGFATSDLTGQHRFDNPVASVRIERIN